MTLVEWADSIIPYVSQFDNIGKLLDDDWQKWGVSLLQPLSLDGSFLPDPYGFTDWREWATRLCEELS